MYYLNPPGDLVLFDREDGVIPLLYSLNPPGDLVLFDRKDGVLHGLVGQGVHTAHKEVQGCQQLLSVLQIQTTN